MIVLFILRYKEATKMKKFIKVILSILLSIITIVNIALFVIIQVTNVNFDKEIQKQNNALVTEWYNENLTKEEKEFHINGKKENYKLYIKNIDKYIKNINVTHIYNTSVTYYDDKEKKTELQEKTIYRLNGNIWCNRLLFPYNVKNWEDFTKYYNNSEYGNGNINSSHMDYYMPLITNQRSDYIYSSSNYTYFPLELLQKSHDEKRQIIQTYNGVDYDVSNNDYKWSHWEHGHIAYVDESSVTDTLTEAIFTFDDGTSKDLVLTNDIDNNFMEEYNMINLYNLSKIELHFNSTVNYSERKYREGFAKACARFEN
jgi:hypothetical protein